MEITQNSNNLLQRENCFKHSIQMAFQDLISWPTLISILEDMTPTFVECKQLVKVLLNELHMLKNQKQIENSQDVQNVNHPEHFQEKAFDDIEIMEEGSKLDNFEMHLVQDTKDHVFEAENIDESTLDHEMPIPENHMEANTDFDEHNFDEYYTFVGSDHETEGLEPTEKNDINDKSAEKSDMTVDPIGRKVSINTERPESGEAIVANEKVKSRNSNPNPKEKRYQCKTCEKTFATSQNLNVHQRIHTGEKPFECKTCLKSFSRKNILEAHERIHTGEKPYKCKYCKKCFTQPRCMKLHETIHTGEVPYECKTCTKKFTQKCILKQHERTHTGEKPYKCRYCNKSFSQLSSLQLHQRSHTGEKPFECKDCKKKFTQKIHLQLHERTHTGEVPFECLQCGKRFKTSSNLRSHKNIHTNEKAYKCKICVKRFSHSTNLLRHMKSSHEENEN